MEVTRQLGDTQVPLASTLTRPDGTVVDLSALTVKFAMVSSNGDVKVAETGSNVSIVSPTDGTVNYAFQDADVDTAGRFYAYFITVNGSSKQDTFPAKRGDFTVVFNGPGL